MRITSFLEKNNIATRETLRIFAVTIFLYWLSWVLLKHNLSWWALSLFFVVLGGTANLYVIDFNNFCMPVLAQSQKEFRKLRELRDEINLAKIYREKLTELSMGMSHDYPLAIQEGATMIRVGSKIFGER